MKTGTLIDLFPGGVFGAGFALVAASALVWGGVQTWRIGNKQDAIDALKLSVQRYDDAQKANLGTIAELQTRLAAAIDLQRLDAREAAAAATRATDTILLVNQRNEQLQGELNELYARNPQARAWGATAVDPAVLRFLPAGPDHQNRDRGSAGAGAKGARP